MAATQTSPVHSILSGAISCRFICFIFTMRTISRMSRFGRAALVVGGCGGVAAGAFALSASSDPTACHGHHSHGGSDSATSRIERLEQQVANLTDLLKEQFNVSMTSGQGKAVFSWDRALTAAFPDGAKAYEKNMHGGFNEDPKTGVVYTGIPGYGLCTISPDLKSWSLLGSDERLKANIHGIVVFEHGGVTSIAIAQNEDQRVLIVGLDGAVKQQLDMPKGGEFNFAEANAYYSKRPKQQCPWETGARAPHSAVFAVTDVTYLNGKLYCVTGYSDGDFVLTASLDEESNAAWGPTAWGGKGDGAAQFQTAHGVFAHDGKIFVANREAHEVLEFTEEGNLVRSLPDIPNNARICNVARAEGEFLFTDTCYANHAHNLTLTYLTHRRCRRRHVRLQRARADRALPGPRGVDLRPQRRAPALRDPAGRARNSCAQAPPPRVASLRRTAGRDEAAVHSVPRLERRQVRRAEARAGRGTLRCEQLGPSTGQVWV
jgi:hypothetical protein